MNESFRFAGFSIVSIEKTWLTIEIYQSNRTFRLIKKHNKTKPELATLKNSLGNKKNSSEIKQFFEINDQDFSAFKDKIESRYEQDWYWV